jgi:dTDP-4-amino-4,6-dideoxygalactose transaminase
VIPFLDLRAQFRPIEPEIRAVVARVFDSCQFVLGEETEAFEEEFARYCGTRYAVAVSSGTSALHLALLVAGIGPGDEVVTVPHTFVATAAAIRHVGARPVFVDIDPRAGTIDPAGIEAVLSPRTRAIVPVHLYGHCADMDPILDVARRHALIVIEDAAQAHGAEYKGRRAGGLGHLACFSFYPGKNLGACGDGGGIVTQDAAFAATLRMLRDHGQRRKYHHELVGYNARIGEIQAAVLRVKLRYLDDWNAARRRHAERYRRLLAASGVRLLDEVRTGVAVHHLFPIFTPQRDHLQQQLGARGVGTGIHYPVPIHLQPAYADLGYRPGQFPHAERASAETLSLPMYAELSDEARRDVCEHVRACVEALHAAPPQTRTAAASAS